jgi:DNA-binding response OmpR family regulator
MKTLADLKVLLVEDNPADARLIVSLLAAVLHAHCDTAASFEEALMALETGGYSLLLLDIVLPDSDTLDGLSYIKKTWPTLPVIVVTGLEDTTALEAVARGAMDFVRKDTLSPDVISRSVHYALRRQEVQNELMSLKVQRRDDIERLYATMRDIQSQFSEQDADIGPLRLRDPVRYQQLLDFYRQSFQAFLQRIREGSHILSFGKALGSSMADHDATPDDAAAMHLTVLEEVSAGLDDEAVQAIAIDGRMFAFEVMGHLANRYRERLRAQ